MIAAAITLTTITDVYPVDPPDNSESAADRDAYRGVAGWMVAIGAFGVVAQTIICKSKYKIYIVRITT